MLFDNKENDLDEQIKRDHDLIGMFSAIALKDQKIPDYEKEKILTLNFASKINYTVNKIVDMVLAIENNKANTDQIAETRKYLALVKCGLDQYYENLRGEIDEH